VKDASSSEERRVREGRAAEQARKAAEEKL
jgi:hypothetical protein